MDRDRTPKVAFGQLREALESLGYSAREVDERFVAFVHPDHPLMIVVPDMAAEELVRPIDLLSVRRTLVNDGVIEDEGFDALFRIKKGDRLIWTVPGTGQEVTVTAAAGESDGMVIIKQRGGAVSPCPVDQLRKARGVATQP